MDLRFLWLCWICTIDMNTADNGKEVFIIGDKTCITNSSSAIVFNPPIDDINVYESTEATYYPRMPNSVVDCNFEKDQQCYKNWTVSTSHWKVVNSLDTPIKGIVTDRRWEVFEITKNTQGFNQIKFMYEFKNPENIQLPLWIRSEADINIFMCSNQYGPGLSDCYWMMITENLKLSGFRKCGLRSIDNSGIPTTNLCRKIRGTKEDVAIRTNIWNHFTIIKRNGTFSVLKDETLYLKFHDTLQSFTPKYMYIYTTKPSLWKIESYNFLYTDEKFNGLIGPNIESFNGTVCISMFVVTCATCTLEISLKTRKKSNSKSKTVYTNTFHTRDEQWQEIVIKKDDVYETLLMKLKTNQTQKSYKFWAIDDIRECSSQQEYRYLQTSESNVPCQNIRNQELIRVDSTHMADQAVQCPENTFGNLCVPCELLPTGSGNIFCRNFKYCENVGKSLQCYCTAGYTGFSCENRCSNKRYGHNCQNICSEACPNCDGVSGFCSGPCTNGFTGNKCNDPPVPTLKYPPEVIESSYDWCKIKINNTIDLERGSHAKDPVTNTYIQYKENVENRQYNTSLFESNNNLEHTIGSLYVDTHYKIRAVLNNATLTVEYTPTTTCYTKCERLKMSDVKPIPFNMSVNVIIDYTPSRSCRIEKYSYLLKNSTGDTIESGYLMKPKFSIQNLTPYTKYYIELLYNGIVDFDSIKFSTLEGVPSAVRDIKIHPSTTNILLNWSEPTRKNGNLFYNIHCKYQQGQACQNNEYTAETPIVIKSNTTFINLSNLKPFSIYQIQIFATTNGGSSDPFNITANTKEQETLSPEELTKINNCTTSSSSISTTLKDINCHEIKGSIWVQLTVCDENYCTSTGPQNVNYSDNILNINSLFPYVIYNVTLEVSRNRKTWKIADVTSISTKSTVPHKVSEAIITSKNETSVSLRWLPPHPPTGKLEIYYIGYNCDYRTGKVNISINRHCCDWSEFRCGTVTGLQPNIQCEIKIFAKNEDHEAMSEVNMGFVKINYDKPLPPYNLNVEWSIDDSMKISWNRPNSTNGNLKKFEIIVNDKSVGEIVLNQKNDCKLTYQYTVKHLELSSNIRWCENNIISVLVQNQGGYTNLESIINSSPPSISEVPIKEILRTPQTISIQLTGVKELCIDYLYLLVTKTFEFNENQLADFEDKVRTQNENDHYLKKNIRCKIDFHKYNLDTYEFTIGNINVSCKNFPNSLLQPDTDYTISMIFVVTCPNNKTLVRTRRSTLLVHTPTFGNKDLYALILLLIPLAIFVWFYFRKKKEINKTVTHHKQLLSQHLCCFERGDENATDVTALAAIRPKAKIRPIVKPRGSIQPHHIKTVNSKLIKITDLEAYIKNAIENGELERQHNLFPKGMIKPCEIGSLPENKAKNRYKNLIAYDHTRVVLEKINGDEHSDYINANYIDGYKMTKAYIATQGPKQSTLHDFWRMIWQENVKNIVMLANIIENGKKKVEQYWPDMHQEKVCVDIRIILLSQNVYANFEHREFEVYYKQETRKINQLHFTTWPDHGVPLYSQSMIVFLQNLLRIPYSADSPILIHCSAGVGRTGTVILSDICLRMAAGEGTVDFLHHLEHLRNQRSNLVDNIEQYKLAHLVVIECLFGMRTAITCNNELPTIIERILKTNGVCAEMNHIEETQWQDRAMETILESDEAPHTYPEKNRFPEIEPANYRIFLTCHPPHDASSSYINAVQVDGFRNPGKYIVTQQPMPNTVGDFWRMIVERRITVILSLNEINPHDKTICQFWPEVGKNMIPVSFIRLKTVQEKSISSCCKIIIVHVDLRGATVLEVEILSMNDWQPNVLLPSSIQNFLTFVEEAETKSRNYQPVVVTCYDGATACGLYIAMTFIIEKMKLEHECDVCQAVRSIRHNRKQFVSSKEQYEFLYRASVIYYGGYQSYSNFN